MRIGKILADNIQWGEGPAFIQKDNNENDYLLFSDTMSNRIYKYNSIEGVTVFRNNSGCDNDDDIDREEPGSNGIATYPYDNNIVFICEHTNRRVSYLDLTTKEKHPIIDKYDGKRFNSPNDIIYSKKRRSIYFTDPPYGLPLKIYNDPTAELGYEGIYKVELDDNLNAISIELLAKMSKPNGLAFSPDEKQLYVSSSDAVNPAWYVFDVTEEGFLENKRKFYDADHLRSHDFEGLPDGQKIDNNGIIYASGPGGLHLFHPDGRHISFFYYKMLIN